jgi:hypothetical protein
MGRYLGVSRGSKSWGVFRQSWNLGRYWVSLRRFWGVSEQSRIVLDLGRISGGVLGGTRRVFGMKSPGKRFCGHMTLPPHTKIEFLRTEKHQALMFQNSRSYLGEVLGGVSHVLAEIWGVSMSFWDVLVRNWGRLVACGRVGGPQGGHGDVDPAAAKLRSNVP